MREISYFSETVSQCGNQMSTEDFVFVYRHPEVRGSKKLMWQVTCTYCFTLFFAHFLFIKDNFSSINYCSILKIFCGLGWLLIWGWHTCTTISVYKCWWLIVGSKTQMLKICRLSCSGGQNGLNLCTGLPDVCKHFSHSTPCSSSSRVEWNRRKLCSFQENNFDIYIYFLFWTKS